MEIRKVKEVVTETIVGYRCDVCNKEHKGASFPDEWHYFSTHHTEWGNDSIDSYESYHVCSIECYVKAFIEVVDNDLIGREGAEVDNFGIQFAKKLSEYFKSNV